MVGGASVASLESIDELDTELARLSRSGGGLRLALGIGLEALAQRGGHHEMGFSSLEAYALERCERSTRWVQESRSLARKLDELPEVRRALLTGRLSWSMASVVASEASREDENAWLAEARHRTVREMRELVKERRGQGQPATKCAPAGAPAPAPAADGLGADEEFCALKVTVDREEAWLFECVRLMVRHVSGGRTLDDVLEALLAEGFSTFCRWIPKEAITEPEEDAANAAQRAWEAELARWRDQADVMCEGRIRKRRETDLALAVDFRFQGSTEHIDRELRRIAAELATRDAAIGRVAERFWQADGWRRLGYGTESQYARERLGMSLSAVKAKRRLARALERLPGLARAVDEGEIGYEAARLVAEVGRTRGGADGTLSSG